jgi:hypothetical protein
MIRAIPAEPVTLSDLDGPIHEVRGLSMALHLAIEGMDRIGAPEAEMREACSVLAATLAHEARSLLRLWEQAFKDQNGPSVRQRLAEWEDKQGRPNKVEEPDIQ